MRLSPAELERITGLIQPAAQCRWFRDHFGANLPADRAGPIITAAAWEAMVAKRCGLQVQATRPQVRTLK